MRSLPRTNRFRRRRLRSPAERSLRELREARAHLLVEKRHVKEREILAWVWETLATSLDYRETQQRVARLAVDLLGDLCGVLEVPESGSSGRAVVLHADPTKAELARRFQARMERGPGGIFVAVLERRRSLLVDLRQVRPRDPGSDDYLELHAALGTHSIMAVPLIARDRLLGVIGMGSASRRYDEQDLELAEEIAQRAALALDNALLYEQSRFQAAVTAHLGEAVMIVRVEDETILYTNSRFEQMFGYEPGEILGQHVSVLNAPDAGDPREVAERITWEAERAGVWHGEVHNIRKDGTTFWTTVGVSGFEHPVLGQVWLSVLMDITERKRLEEANVRALREKEVLLKEIHHRVKNNLQVISSLFYLQRRRLEDEQLQSLLDESRSRVESIALIHEQLYQSASLADIDLDDYLKRLLAALVATFGAGQIEARSDAAGVVLDVEQAVPCGLLISELVSNSLKHAFRNRPGAVWVRAFREGDRDIVLDVGDDGDGIPDDVDWRRARGLGLQLVQSLAKQLRASLQLDRSAGTRFTVRFEAAAPPP